MRTTYSDATVRLYHIDREAEGGAPATLCRTLGMSECIRVPLPAARMTRAVLMCCFLFVFSAPPFYPLTAGVQGKAPSNKVASCNKRRRKCAERG